MSFPPSNNAYPFHISRQPNSQFASSSGSASPLIASPTLSDASSSVEALNVPSQPSSGSLPFLFFFGRRHGTAPNAHNSTDSVETVNNATNATFTVRRNFLDTFRSSQWKDIFHYCYLAFHVGMILATISCLVYTWHTQFAIAKACRAFLSFMIVVSSCRIFLAVYARQHPLLVLTDWGSVEYRQVDTLTGHVALFLHRNLDLICLISVFMAGNIFSGTEEGKECLQKAPFLYYITSAWIFTYFLALVMPVFLLMSFLVCLPFGLLLFQQFYTIPTPTGQNSNRRAQGATRDLLEKIWHCKYRSDSTFQYRNPEDPTQTLQIAKEDAKCTICLSLYEADDELRILSCHHHFHQPCADEWFRITATCPLCVQPIACNANTTANPDSNV